MLRSSARILFALLLVGGLLFVFQPWKHLDLLIDASPTLLVLGIAAAAFGLAMNALAYSVLVRTFKPIPYFRMLGYTLKAWVVESALPGKLGSFSIAWFWRTEGIRVGEGLGMAFLYRATLGLIVLIVGIVGGLSYYSTLAFSPTLILTLLGAGLLLAWVAWNQKWYAALVKRLPEKWIQKYGGFSTALRRAKEHPHVLVALLGLGFLQVAGTSLLFEWMFMSVGYDPGFIPLFVANSLVQLAALIPLSINGLGIREGLLSILLVPFGVPASVALGVSVFNTAVGYALSFAASLIWARDASKMIQSLFTEEEKGTKN